MTRLRCLAPLLVMLVVTVPVSAQDASFQAVLDSARAALDVPGASAALAFSDGTLWSGSSGTAAPGVPVTPTTAFELGSVAKTYAAALVLALSADGRLNLDDTLDRWYPDIPGADRIPVEWLLNHTHGLHDPSQEPDFIPTVLRDPARTWTLADVLDRLGPSSFEPGTGWKYSNTGFHLAGAIVEAVTDSAFGAVLEARLLGPLHFDETWYGVEDPDGASVAAAYIDPDGSGTPRPVSLMIPWTAFRSSAGPAGGVVATAPDAARWLHALTTGGVLEDREWERMTRWVERPDGNRYGLGLLCLEREGKSLIGHKGNSAGYSASVFHDPATGITAAVLTNGHLVDVSAVAEDLLAVAAESRAPAGPGPDGGGATAAGHHPR